MLNDDDAGDGKKGRDTRPSQDAQRPPPVPLLQTHHSSFSSNAAHSQASPSLNTPRDHSASYAHPPYLDRRSSSYQSQPITPHTPSSAHHQQHGYFPNQPQYQSPLIAHHSSSPYIRPDPSPSAHSNPTTASFGPPLRPPPTPTQPTYDSPRPVGSRQSSGTFAHPATPGAPAQSSISAPYRQHVAQSPMAIGRQSLSVSPKSLPHQLLPGSRQGSVHEKAANREHHERTSNSVNIDAGKVPFIFTPSVAPTLKTTGTRPGQNLPATLEKALTLTASCSLSALLSLYFHLQLVSYLHLRPH